MSNERENSDAPSNRREREHKEAAPKGRKAAVHASSVATKEPETASDRAKASIEGGRKAVAATADRIAGTAGATWTAVKNRKAIAVGAGAGLIGVAGAAFAAGRATTKAQSGPLTRLTHGRI
ncbi:hypothetical protein ACIRPT_35415 [Streptomyces sp. NPDC101227]|uniref:hypothetical protein n=1 Tax=Streptomyces sp. NPDC101227 TaxID=3366136 RepID=UPI0038023601